ncbi:PITH domain-containing protein [Dichomitus squalens]|nr:PITH domain-containing protein [Dichomitus squalens]
MSFRRVNRSKKVPNVKLRPAAPSARRDLRTPDSTWQHSSGLDSDEEASRTDLCPRPFKGFVLCATGIDDKTSLFKLALELGAQSLNDFTDRVTHLIAEEPGSAKYKCALENRIPIMHPSWIIESHKIWLRGDDVDVTASLSAHRLPIFAGVVLCVSGIDDVARRMEINRALTAQGGTYVKQIIRPVRVTHLICGNESEEGESEKVRYAVKFNQGGEARIRIVWEDWFWDSLRFGGRFDEERYEVGKPRAPPRVLPDDTTPSPPSSSAGDPSGLSSEIQHAETSAAGRARPPANANEEEEEIASVKRVPAVTLHLWESILKPRGFEVQDGRLIRSPSKSQVANQQQAQRHREPSPSRIAAVTKGKEKLSRRGTLQAGAYEDEDARPVPKSALSSFQRARSFIPPPQHASTPVGARQQPFQRATTTASRTSSFLQRSVGSVHAAGGVSTEVPVASTSAVAGPSTSRDGSEVPALGDDPMASAASEGLSEKGRTMFSGLKFRALGEARCAPVRRAIEAAGGRWLRADDDEDADIVLVRLISGSSLFRQEADEGERAKYRTECWLERCLFEERVCEAGEHVAFTPLRVQPPVRGAEGIVVSCSGLDQAERCVVQRLLRALGVTLAPAFSRRSTHLLCPSGIGAKAEKAGEWGIPIVDMAWLATIANTGEVPRAPAMEAEEQAQAHDGAVLDLKLLSQPPRGPDEDEFMASQPPATIPAPKIDVKGKGKATETMVDITNARGDDAQAQSLSYYDPPGPDEPRPGQAEQMETFGMPDMLLGPAATAPATPRRSARAAPDSNDKLPATQAVPVQDEGESVSIPSRVYEDRIPSSASPSPMRMPGMPTPQDSAPKTPVKVAKQATVVIQNRLTTLLGKRPSEEDEEVVQVKKRTRSNMSFTDMLGTPGQSPASAFAAASSPVQPPEPDLVPQLPDAGTSVRKHASKPASSSSDEVDGSFVGGDANESICIAYADPMQNGELDRLKFLFNEAEGTGRPVQKEDWEMELEKEMDVTLPQLAEVRSASGLGKKAVALNAEEPGKGPEIIKPWDQRIDEETYIESDADDQLIIRVPFTGAVKLRALLLKTGPGEKTAAKVALFPNAEHVDFSDLEDRKPAQEFTIPQRREVGEYHVLPAKFPNLTSITLFFPASQGADTTRVYYVGFLGQWSERKFEPVVTVYESKPNLADHDKIQGLNENWTTPDSG